MIYKVMQHYAQQLSCTVENFLNDNNIITLRKDNSESFFSMFCFGYAAIANIPECMYDWCNNFLNNHKGFRCFDGIQLIEISKELAKYNFSISCGQAMLPDLSVKNQLPDTSYRLQLFKRHEMNQLKNSSIDSINEETEFAYAAFDADKIIGIAPANSCGDNIFEIGIDVLPEYRRGGIASALTMKLTEELLKQDKIPYAITAWSNIASRGVLHRCNYYPSWVRMDSMDKIDADNILNGKY